MATQMFGGFTQGTVVAVGLAGLGLGVVLGGTAAVVYGATAVTDAGAKRQSSGLAARAAKLAKAEEAKTEPKAEEAKADAAKAAKAAKA